MTEALTDHVPLRELVDAALRGELPPAQRQAEPPIPIGHLRLLSVTLGVLRAVVELHAPTYDRHWVCQGCDADGYEWEPPDWPCSTVGLIAEQFGITLEPADD